MDPSEIKRLIGQSKYLLKDDKTCPEAFLLAFVAWEALKIRILLVGFAAGGISVTAGREIIRERGVWKDTEYQKLFQELFGCLPNSAKWVGSLFNRARGTHKLRGKFIHGEGRTSPEKFRTHALTLLSIVEADWASGLIRLLHTQGKQPLSADPLRPIRRHIQATGSSPRSE